MNEKDILLPYDEEIKEYIILNHEHIFQELKILSDKYPIEFGKKMPLNKIYRPTFGKSPNITHLIALQGLFNQLAQGKTIDQLKKDFSKNNSEAPDTDKDIVTISDETRNKLVK
ncbi:hypothetical protein GF376_04950 [Candidatus Peregrinibacteria bacterium]|nr:hypothetical protein [Candidatus Peregrinibacteria bacterium]